MTRDAARLHRRLLPWFDRAARDLPWRRLDDPYGVWVSEVMLQQTRVETVVPYFVRWMARFPDVGTLASASRDEVLRSWQGLGYYSRARALHDAARRVVAEHDGQVPATYERLRTLPGVGPYTAGAIASIAFGERVAAVDGNVLRVVARLTGSTVDIVSPAGRKTLAGIAGRWVPRARPGDWNQALMELGATVCRPKRPDCTSCPVADVCVARASDAVARLPVRATRRAPVEVSVRLAWVERDGHVLLARAPDAGLLAGLWGLPGGSGAPLSTLVRRQTGIGVRAGRVLGTAEHAFTHRAWHIEVRRCRPTRDEAGTGLDDGASWAPLDRLDEWPVSVAHRKAIGVARRMSGGKSLIN